ncbi:MAG: PAS domain-containing protein [Caulobacteraceae bacterium]|nr:PAS domain-containing protein [Caulobacteraceae bacterium]
MSATPGSETLTTPFDRLTALACAALDVPFGLVSVLEENQAVFRSEIGVGQKTLPREISVSARLVAMGPDATLVVPDSLEDPELCTHPMVVAGPRIRFFAGATICDGTGRPIGAIGAMDTVPRDPPTPAQMTMLRHIAGLAGDLFDQLTAARAQAEQLALLELTEELAGTGHWRFDLVTGKVDWSDEVYRIHGRDRATFDPGYGDVLADYHPEDREMLAACVERAIATGQGYSLDLRLISDTRGERRVTTRAGTQCDEAGKPIALYGAFRDVTESILAEERLRESEALFRMMSETATDIIARYQPDGTFLYVSPSAEAILGYRPDQMLGRRCAEFVHTGDHASMEAVLLACLRSGPGAPMPRLEYRAIRADGTIVWLEASPRAVWDETGRTLLELHDHIRDVTARKTAERVQFELVETLEMAEALAESGSWRLDIATGKLVWSDQVYRIHGKSRETFDPGLDDAIGCYHPDDRQAVQDSIAHAIRTGKPGGFQLRLIREDGEQRIVNSQFRPECDETGATTALFGVFQDVTDERRAQQKIEESEARYRLLADHASDIILTYGVDGRIRYVSPSVEAVSGVAPAALIGQPVTAMIHSEDVQRLTEAFRELVRSGGATGRVGLRYRGNLASGETRWFEARTTLIRDDAGRVVEFHDVVRDVTATKALEDELIAARDVAEAATRAKSEFLANMSHELRTPLTGVIGFAGLLQASAALPDAERHYADRVATASEALLSVINDILDYSKLEADAISLDSRAFDPAAMARGAAAIVEAQCGAKGLALRVETPDGLPAAIVGDEARLRQVTLNLLSNAVKFTASGEIVLSVRRVNTRLRVTVTDSGIGIAAERIEALFERFAQADASTTRLYGGTGLGLAISRRLVEVMGGEIGVESRLGEGSSFWFEIPLVVAEQGPSTISGVHTALPPDLKVLLADDTPANRELVLLILTAIGIQPDPVCDGAEALKAAARGDYDLILMDVHMPVMDGLAATRAIRALPGPAAATPILALTASVLPEQIEACRRAGMDGHVGKPIKVEALINAMASALNAAAISDTASAA